MQNKGAIRLFAILLTVACIYYLMFTVKTTGVEKEARQISTDYANSPAVQQAATAYANGNEGKLKFYTDSIIERVENNYLDSMKKQVIYNIGITKFTYEKAKEQEINLGLDLRGGMNVTLEISVGEIIRQMASESSKKDKFFNEALDQAEKLHGTSSKDYVTLFGEAYHQFNPNGKLASHFQTIELKGKVDFNTKDEDVLSLIRTRVSESIDVSETTLRARIDKFGVTQPTIQKLESSGRVLVELPGVKDKRRVEKLLQGTANLEFWETYTNQEIYPKLVEANTRLKEILNPKDTAKVDSVKAVTITTPAVSTAVKNNLPDSLNKIAKTDTTKGSLDALNNVSSDTSKTGSLTAVQDTAAERMRKENPLLYTLLQPSAYQTQQGGYSLAEGPVVGLALPRDTGKINSILNFDKIKKMFPSKVRFVWTLKPVRKDGDAYGLVALKVTTRDGKAALYGDIITDARWNFDQTTGGRQISMSMTSDASQTWKHLTGEVAKEKGYIAIVLDGVAYSYPSVNQEISGGNSQITGSFSLEEADDLVNVLKAGKLPAPAHIVAEETVGPTLGKEAISSGLFSFLIALILVLVFMGFYYNKAGLVADIALFFNVFFVMGVLASLGAVLTLPGIAGIVLTIGLSVDANILIFERVREELASGKGVGMAIKEGFANAMSSILDSNVTTLLLGVILFMFGTGPIQGFATTLIIGILTSLFSAIFITRLIFDWMLSKNHSIKFSTKFTENAFKNININFVGKRKLYYLFSTAIIVVGIISYFQKGGFNLGVDFKGGRTYVVLFSEPKPTEDVRKALISSFGAEQGLEVKTYGGASQLRITTTYMIENNGSEVEEQVQNKLEEGLNSLNTKYEIRSTVKVGETVSRDIKTKAVWAILFSCLVMFIYIFIRFKKWQYGLGSVVALFHDVLIVLSCYTIFDGLLPFSLEIDQHFIAAILTVMGYSMTDTVVVFDRIREYLADKNKTDLSHEERNSVINYALNSTLSRTINTSLTIFFVLLAIFIFGGETIKGFSFALLIGIVIGTYSSICIATPVVIDFEGNKQEGKK